MFNWLKQKRGDASPATPDAPSDGEPVSEDRETAARFRALPEVAA